MRVIAVVNTPSKRGRRPYTGKATKIRYGMIDHNHKMPMETADIARQPGMFLNEHGAAFESNGSKINVLGLTVVDNGAPAPVRHQQNEALVQKLTALNSRRELLLADSGIRADNALSLEAELYPEQQQVPVQGYVAPVTNESVARELTEIDGIGQKTAERLVELGVQSWVDLADLDDEELLELDVNKGNIPSIRRWIKENTDQVEDNESPD